MRDAEPDREIDIAATLTRLCKRFASRGMSNAAGRERALRLIERIMYRSRASEPRKRSGWSMAKDRTGQYTLVRTDLPKDAWLRRFDGIRYKRRGHSIFVNLLLRPLVKNPIPCGTIDSETGRVKWTPTAPRYLRVMEDDGQDRLVPVANARGEKSATVYYRNNVLGPSFCPQNQRNTEEGAKP